MMNTISALYVPGPGFWVVSPGIAFLLVILYIGQRDLKTPGSVTLYVPGPGV